MPDISVTWGAYDRVVLVLASGLLNDGFHETVMFHATNRRGFIEMVDDASGTMGLRPKGRGLNCQVD
jgi:hypothetical protein